MWRALGWFVALVALATACEVLNTHHGRRDGPPAVELGIGVVVGQARDQMEHDWSDTVPQVEHGYCVTGWRTDTVYEDGEPTVMYAVTAVVPADSQIGTPVSITYMCATTEPTVHSHPPQTCTDSKDLRTCTYAGVLAFQCQPSRVDYQSLVAGHTNFALVQCGRTQFRFYYRRDYRP
jgi:hypothetical protein